MPYARVKNELPLIPGYTSGDIVTISDALTDSVVNTLTATVRGSGCNVTRMGKNFIDLSLDNLENGSINGNTGALESSTNRVRNKDYYEFPFDKIYNSSYIITIPSGYSLAMRFYDSTGNYIAMTGESTGWITELPSSVYGRDASYVKFVFRKSDNTDITPSTISSLQYQLELGTATTYEPYTSTTYPITFPSSVASGSITINADGSVDLTSGGTTTRLTDTANVTILPGTNNIWIDIGDIENLVYIRR